MAAHGIDSTTMSREKAEKPWIRAASMAGYNFRLSNILAALGVAQMKHLDAMNESRRRIAGLYREALEKREIVLPVERAEAYHVYQMYTVKVPKECRTAMIAGLRAKGIGASVHFDPPVHRQPFYKEQGFKTDGLEITERLADSILTLPMYPQMSEADVAWVAGAFGGV
jgi:perosamine synthetase